MAAAAAFARGQEAELSGDYARAAELFELADRIAPTPEALRSATRARLAAGQLAPAAENAEALWRRYHGDPPSRELASQVLSRARRELARYSVTCREPCTVLVDGLASGVSALRSQTVYLAPGAHALAIGVKGQVVHSLRVHALAGQTRALAPEQIAPHAPHNPEREQRSAPKPANAPSTPQGAGRERGREGIAPGYFWFATSLTFAASGLAVWSGLDLLKARDRFQADPRPSRAAFEDGERRDLRTNILLGSAGALALVSVVLFARSDFGGAGARPSTSLQGERGGARVLFRTRF